MRVFLSMRVENHDCEDWLPWLADSSSFRVRRVVHLAHPRSVDGLEVEMTEFRPGSAGEETQLFFYPSMMD